MFTTFSYAKPLQNRHYPSNSPADLIPRIVGVNAC
jgi:hypothetical protein